jgi:UDP-N-acetylmuramate dehydrogenase
VGKVKGFYRAIEDAGIGYKKDYVIRDRTSFRIGGKVECYLTAGNTEQVTAAIKAAARYKKKIFVMGNLSNVLIADGKIKMIFMELTGDFENISIKGKTGVYAGAGVKNSVLLGWLTKKGLGGIEFMAGIPGTVGGAVYMNAGAFGQGIGSFIKKVHFVDKKGKCGIIENGKEAFSYRHSIFQDNGFIITGVEMTLKKRISADIVKEMADIIKLRHSRHPWRAYCAGSYFKNGKDYTAGKLIEEAGLKGKKCGKAEVSNMHANFIVNTGGAKFKDVVKLADDIKKEVFRKYKVKLQEEVKYIK